MALTKAQARSLTREWLDDPDEQFWSNANLDLLLGLVLDDLWSELLSELPHALSRLDTLGAGSVTNPGYVDLRTTTNGGALSQRFYRLQSVTREEIEYTPIDPRDVTIEDSEVVVSEAPDRTFYVRGDQLWLFPLDDGEGVEVRYSYLPASFDALSDSDTVPWPDGHETAYVLEAAGRAMLKGDRESGERLLGMARASFNRAKVAMDRAHLGPDTPFMVSTPFEWGGVQ